jgi:hypothetical protein
MAVGLARRYDAAPDPLTLVRPFVPVTCAAIALLAPAELSAQARVVAHGCEPLDGALVGELLGLELGGDEASRGLEVALTCSESSLRISVRDPLTEKSVERESARVDPADPEAPRVIAILVSGLVLASWAELLLSSGVSAESSDPERIRAAREVAARELANAAERAGALRAGPRERGTSTDERSDASSDGSTPDAPPIEEPSLRVEAGLDAGLRLRDLSAPFAGGDFGARGMLWFTRELGVGLRASGEIARVGRASGHVTFGSIAASAVLAYVPFRRAESFALELAIEPRIGWARLEGGASAGEVVTDTLDSALVEIEASLAPVLAFESFELALVLRAGATLYGPTGHVTGEPDVALPGFFAGASLRGSVVR